MSSLAMSYSDWDAGGQTEPSEGDDEKAKAEKGVELQVTLFASTTPFLSTTSDVIATQRVFSNLLVVASVASCG